MADIVDRLRCYARDDHERGCNGRYYDCSCGYDGKRDTLLVESADEIERLRAALGSIKWLSADRDNMEYAATITYSQMDAIRAALGGDK